MPKFLPSNKSQAANVLIEIFNKFDFSLIPCYLIDKIDKNSTDLVTNFASFNEMPKVWFDKYMRSELLQSSKYIYTMNRISRPPMNNNDSMKFLF